MVINGNEVNIKEILSINEMFQFVEFVVNGCFDKDGKYTPEFKDYLMRFATIHFYTDYTIPDGNNEAYMFLYSVDGEKLFKSAMFGKRVEGLDPSNHYSQWLSISDAIDEKIRIRADAGVNAIAKAANDVVNEANSVINQFRGVFEDIDVDGFNKIANAFSHATGDMTTQDLVKSIVEASNDNKKPRSSSRSSRKKVEMIRPVGSKLKDDDGNE